jgi:hypothetical protein
MFQRNRFRPCKNCQKPVLPQDKNCPYCGSPVGKDVLPKCVIGGLLLILISTLAIPSKSSLEKEREKIANAAVATVNIGDLFHNDAGLGLDKIGEFEGKIVELQLQVFVATYVSDHYRIVTIPSDGIPGTLLTLYPKNKAESDFLKHIKAGHTIKIRGKIKGTLLKRIKIDPAFLI